MPASSCGVSCRAASSSADGRVVGGGKRDVQPLGRRPGDDREGAHGPPGERRYYHPGYYAAFVLDPDGSNVELVSHNR
jgi:hypothetical protein